MGEKPEEAHTRINSEVNVGEQKGGKVTGVDIEDFDSDVTNIFTNNANLIVGGIAGLAIIAIVIVVIWVSRDGGSGTSSVGSTASVAAVTSTPTPTLTPTITPSPTPEITEPPTPVVVKTEVSAKLGWQSTRMEFEAGTTVGFEVVAGEWTTLVGSSYPYTNGSGFYLREQDEYICTRDPKRTDCAAYPMPDKPLGGLIGRVGGESFYIGPSRSAFLIRDSGILELRINDEDAGLGDNDGILTVQITVE